MKRVLMTGLLVCGCAAAPAQSGPVEREAKPITLSYLRTAGAGRCAWTRHALPTAVEVVATVDGDCSGGATMAWSADGHQGAILDGPQKTIVLVDFAATSSRSIAVPELGITRDIGFDGATLVALVMTLDDHGVTIVERPNDGPQLIFEGVQYDAPADGEPGLAHAYRYEDRTWRRTDIVASTWGWDYAAGVDALPVAQSLGPRTSILTGGTHGFEVLETAPASLAAARPISSEPGHWARVGSFWVWAEDGEFPIPVAPMFIADREVVEPWRIPAVADGTYLSFDEFGGALVVRDGNGFVHVVDLSKRSVVGVVGGATLVTLWR